MKNRKTTAIVFCSAAISSLVPVLLYQTRVLRRLPDPPGDVFDSEQITTSARAFPLGIPDAALGLASYGTTLGLLLTNKDAHPLFKKALQAKLALDGAMAGAKAVQQVVDFKRVCSWCMGTALATAGMIYFGITQDHEGKSE